MGGGLLQPPPIGSLYASRWPDELPSGLAGSTVIVSTGPTKSHTSIVCDPSSWKDLDWSLAPRNRRPSASATKGDVVLQKNSNVSIPQEATYGRERMNVDAKRRCPKKSDIKSTSARKFECAYASRVKNWCLPAFTAWPVVPNGGDPGLLEIKTRPPFTSPWRCHRDLLRFADGGADSSTVSCWGRP